MYIGPWQEYNMFKARPVPSVAATKKQAALKQDIEKAILSSLDPISARKALDAMHPLLERLPSTAVSAMESSSSSRLLLGRPNADRMNPAAGNSNNKPLPALQNNNRIVAPLHLPVASRDAGIPAQSHSGRTYYEPAPPLSAKSSSSEPISRAQYELKQQQNANKLQQPKAKSGVEITNVNSNDRYNVQLGLPPRKEDRQPPYNASSMVSLLRLEREARERQSKFAKFWDWNNKAAGKATHTHAADMTDDIADLSRPPSMTHLPLQSGAGVANPKTREEIAIEKKLNAVNKMKEMYLSETQMEKVPPEPLALSLSKNSSNASLEQTQRPAPFAKETKPMSLSVSVTRKDVDALPPKTQLPTGSNQHAALRVNNFELTDLELLAVSKYFDSPRSAGSPSPPREYVAANHSNHLSSSSHQQAANNSRKMPISPIRVQGTGSPVSGANVSVVAGRSALQLAGGNAIYHASSYQSSNSITKPHSGSLGNMVSISRPPSNFRNPATPSSIGKGASTPGSKGAFDVDGLINWSMNLDIDFV